MAIRKNTNPHDYDLSGGLSDVLRRNGMQAHLSIDADGPKLIVLGHDSPGMTYKITDKQAEAMMDWGTNSGNQKAYTTFVNLVKDDFEVPKDFVHARNVNSKVAMGLHGYRLGPGEYGIPDNPWASHRRGWGGDFLGWSERQQPGYHLRRIDGRLFMPNPIVPERPDGAMKPGELTSGGYGFYYKGRQKETHQDVLKDMQPIVAVNRPKGQAIPYELSSPVYFTNEKLQKSLSSHGFIIDKASKTLTVQAQNVNQDLRYSLTDKELQILTSNKLNPKKGGHHLKERFELINHIIKKDFDVPADDKKGAQLIFDNIKTKDRIDIQLKPSVQKELGMKQQENIRSDKQAAQGMDIIDMADAKQVYRTGFIDKKNTIGVVDGHALDPDKGWYLPVDNGRAVSVGEIRAYSTNEGYQMTAVVNGQVLTHSIDEDTYRKFLNYNDQYRMKLFDKVFDEVQLKSAYNGTIEDNVASGKLEEAKGVISLTGGYSLISQQRNIPIESAMAWKDQVSGNYSINVKLAGDASIRTFKITEAQYQAFAQATEEQRAQLLTAMIPFKDKEGESLHIVKNIHLPVSDIEKDTKAPHLSDERAAEILNKLHHTGDGFHYEAIKSNHLSDMSKTEANMIAAGKAAPNPKLNQAAPPIGLHGDAGTNGASLNNLDQGHQWYRGGSHGRASTVGDITVARVKDAEGRVIEGKYRMTAVIDGNVITHEINQKTYDKFLQVDNLHRMKLFDKVFDEVKIHGDGSNRVNIGAAILAALTTGLDVMDDLSRPHGRPEIYMEGYTRAPIYYKPGVVSPAEIAAARFENEDTSREVRPADLSQGRGL
jgi:hypothetical protein